MLKTLLRVAQCDLNNPFSWISPDIIKLFYGPHDTFISSVSALYPVRGAEGGGGIPVLYAVFFSVLLQCSCCRTFDQTLRRHGRHAPPPHTKNMKCRVTLGSGKDENRKPNNVTIILCTYSPKRKHISTFSL